MTKQCSSLQIGKTNLKKDNIPFTSIKEGYKNYSHRDLSNSLTVNECSLFNSLLFSDIH